MVAHILTRFSRLLLWCLGESPRTDPPDEGGHYLPDAGKPAPLSPSPTHHLVAARSLPPQNTTHLFPAD
jgi:hypothetical protein